MGNTSDGRDTIGLRNKGSQLLDLLVLLSNFCVFLGDSLVLLGDHVMEITDLLRPLSRESCDLC